MTTGTPPRFTQLSRWSPVIDPRNGEDGPPDQPGCTPHTIYPLVTPWKECVAYAIAPPTNGIHFSPLLPMVSHIGPREYTSPAPMRRHNPFPLFH